MVAGIISTLGIRIIKLKGKLFLEMAIKEQQNMKKSSTVLWWITSTLLSEALLPN